MAGELKSRKADEVAFPIHVRTQFPNEWKRKS